jgi:hypothetical protein
MNCHHSMRCTDREARPLAARGAPMLPPRTQKHATARSRGMQPSPDDRRGPGSHLHARLLVRRADCGGMNPAARRRAVRSSVFGAARWCGTATVQRAEPICDDEEWKKKEEVVCCRRLRVPRASAHLPWRARGAHARGCSATSAVRTRPTTAAAPTRRARRRWWRATASPSARGATPTLQKPSALLGPSRSIPHQNWSG